MGKKKTPAEKEDEARKKWRLFYWDENNKDVKDAVFFANAEALEDIAGTGKKVACLHLKIKTDTPPETEKKIKEFKTSLPLFVERQEFSIKAKKPNTP